MRAVSGITGVIRPFPPRGVGRFFSTGGNRDRLAKLVALYNDPAATAGEKESCAVQIKTLKARKEKEDPHSDSDKAALTSIIINLSAQSGWDNLRIRWLKLEALKGQTPDHFHPNFCYYNWANQRFEEKHCFSPDCGHDEKEGFEYINTKGLSRLKGRLLPPSSGDLGEKK